MTKYLKIIRICFAAFILPAALLIGCRQAETVETSGTEAVSAEVQQEVEVGAADPGQKEMTDTSEMSSEEETDPETEALAGDNSTGGSQTGKVAEQEEAAAMNKAVEKILKDNSLGFQYSEYDKESQVYIYYFNNSKVTSIYIEPDKYEETVTEFETKMNALCRSVLASWSSAGMDIHTEFIFLNSVNPENLLFASFDGYTLYSAK